MSQETKMVMIPTGATLYLDTSAWNLLVVLVRSLGLEEAPLDEVVDHVSRVLSPTSAEMTFLAQVKFLQDSESTPLTVVVSSETIEFCVKDVVVGKFW